MKINDEFTHIMDHHFQLLISLRHCLHLIPKPIVERNKKFHQGLSKFENVIIFTIISLAKSRI